jgi:hypothetical protein
MAQGGATRWLWRLTAVPAVCMLDSLLIGVDVVGDCAPAGGEAWRLAVVARPLVARGLADPGTVVAFRHAGLDRTRGGQRDRLGVIAAGPGGWVNQYVPVAEGVYVHGAGALHAGFVGVAVSAPPAALQAIPPAGEEHLLYDDEGGLVTVVPYRALRGRILALLT